MIQIVKPVAGILEFNTGFYLQILDGITEELARQGVVSGSNPVLWIAGHLANSRYALMGSYFNGPDYERADLFARGTTYSPDTNYPDLSVFKDDWSKAGEDLSTALENMDELTALKEIETKFPLKEQNVLNALAFFQMHESYHIGQLGYLRTALGLERVV